MKKIIVFGLAVFFSCGLLFSQNNGKYGLIIHGGAGNFNSEDFDKEIYNAHYNTLDRVLTYGDSLLSIGYSAVDVVEACVIILEDCPFFNAGRGAVLNIDGKPELDASIMDGKTLNAGAVSGVTTIKNPVKAARTVMDSSRHVLLISKGAEKFAKEYELEIVSQEYFIEDRMYQRYLERKEEQIKGTVGAVALDKNGNLAAATSTGGMMLKQYGRVGDVPIIGAGCYADNSAAAISCTGHGEFFIRTVAAYNVIALMKYSGMSLERATQKSIDRIGEFGTYGGMIAIDKNGNMTMPFNSKSMFRAYINSDNKKEILF